MQRTARPAKAHGLPLARPPAQAPVVACAVVVALALVALAAWPLGDVVGAGFAGEAARMRTELLGLGVGARVGRPAVRPLLGGRLASAERRIEHGGATALLAARLVPLVPFNAVCYVSGVARVPSGATRGRR